MKQGCVLTVRHGEEGRDVGLDANEDVDQQQDDVVLVATVHLHRVALVAVIVHRVQWQEPQLVRVTHCTVTGNKHT